MTMTAEKVLYTAKAHITGGRDGASRSSDSRLDIKLSVPEQMGGKGQPDTKATRGNIDVTINLV